MCLLKQIVYSEPDIWVGSNPDFLTICVGIDGIGMSGGITGISLKSEGKSPVVHAIDASDNCVSIR